MFPLNAMRKSGDFIAREKGVRGRRREGGGE